MCGRTRVAGVLRKLQRGLNSQDRQSNRNTKDSGETKNGGTQSYTFVLSNNMKMGRDGASANAIEDFDKCKHLENMTPGHYSLVLKMDVSGKSVGKHLPCSCKRCAGAFSHRFPQIVLKTTHSECSIHVLTVLRYYPFSPALCIKSVALFSLMGFTSSRH